MARILIVDDERNNREVLREVLVEDGYEVQCAETPREALERALHAEPEVVITDLDLRDLSDGADVARALLEMIPRIHIIAMSALPSEQVNRRFAGIKILAILRKPFEVAQLEAILRAALADSEDTR